MLSWVGSRCCTRMNAMPLSAGSASTNFRQASSPPAEAPIATTRVSASRCLGLQSLLAASGPIAVGRQCASGEDVEADLTFTTYCLTIAFVP